MEFKDLKIILYTCDKYMQLIELVAWTMEKYWKEHQEVILLGYKPPKWKLPKKWSFVSLGKDRGYKAFGEDMISFFKDFNDEYFIYREDDKPLMTHVDMGRLIAMWNLLISKPDIKKALIGGTHANRPERWTDIGGGLAFLKPSADYQITRGDDIWDTKYFKSFLKKGESGADFETKNLRHQDGMKKIVCIKQPPLVCTHLFVRSGEFNRENWNKHERPAAYCNWKRISLSKEDEKIHKKFLRAYGISI